MNGWAEAFLHDLGRATAVLAAAACVTFVLLRAFGVKSPTMHRVAWCGVLLQGWLIAHITLLVPWYDPAPPAEMPPPEPVVAMEAELIPVVEPDPAPAAAVTIPAAPAAMGHLSTPEPAGDASWRVNWPGVLCLVWIAGMVLALVRWGAGYLLFWRSLRPIAAEPHWEAEWRELQQDAGIRRPIPLVATEADGPMICRLPRGLAVVVPGQLWRQFDARQRRLVLRHELAHYRRGDVWKSLTVRLAALPHWFNPFARLAVRRFDEAAEWACDDEVVATGREHSSRFAQTLLELGTVAAPPLAHSPAAHRHPLARRIRRMLSPSGDNETRLKRGLVAAAVLAALLVNAVRVELVARAAPQQDAEKQAAGEAPKQKPVAAEPKAAAPRKLPDHIQRAAEFLYSKQRPDGSWSNGSNWDLGVTALCTWSLLECGVDRGHPQVAKALGYLRTKKPTRTYEVALHTLALCAGGDKNDMPLVQNNVRALEKGQIGRGPGKGAWSYGSGIDLATGDHSNSEFAVWGLAAAADFGAKVQPATWEMAYDHWRQTQLGDGGWGYTSGNSPATGTMTCAGIASLVTCYRHVHRDKAEEAPDVQELIEPSVEWLGKNFSVGLNPQKSTWLLYYLMVLRNAGELTGIEKFGEHAWYAEARDFLMKHQNAGTGSWKGTGHMDDELVSTAMALLFLRQGPPQGAKGAAGERVGDERLAERKAAVEALNRLELRFPLEVGDGERPYFEVNLTGSRATDAQLVHVKSIGPLLRLDIESTGITDAGLVHVMPLTGLRELWVQRSQITVAGIRELWRVMPRLRVVGIGTLSEGDPETARKLLRAAGDAQIAKAAAEKPAKTPTPVERDIFTALKRRDDAVRSFRFRWVEHQTDHKDSRHSTASDDKLVSIIEDVDVTNAVELTVDGSKVFYEYIGDRVVYGNSGEPTFTKYENRSAFDGWHERSYVKNLSQPEVIQGFSTPANRSDTVSLASTDVLRWLYCSFDPVMTHTDWETLSVSEESEKIRGRQCYRLQRRYAGARFGDQNRSTSSWWVDPGRDYVIVRRVYSDGRNRIQSRFDIDYQQDAAHGWVPSHWRFQRFNAAGKVRLTTIARVTDYEINPQLADDIFTLQFPEGTHMNP